MNFIITTAVTVDDTIGIHATCNILKLRIFNQHLVELLWHHIFIKVDITFSHQFNKELIDFDIALLGNLDDIFCGDRKRTLLVSVKFTIDFSNQFVGKVLLCEVYDVVEHEGRIADAVSCTVNGQTQSTTHFLQLTDL